MKLNELKQRQNRWTVQL